MEHSLLKKTLTTIGVFLFFLCTNAYAQFDFTKWVNPGPLSSPHSTLEGIKNCTQCHSTAKGVPDEKCLNCHKEISQRINQRRGYHSRISGTCVSCHSEHKGVEYDVTGLSRMQFDHTETGWPLTGKHNKIDCPKCHTKLRKNIMTGQLGRRRTYLGNNSSCVVCHKSPHKNKKQTFQQCYKCHDTSAWEQRNQSNFNHDKETSFALTGSHKSVDCLKCHTTKIWSPMSMQCVSCHKDPHNDQFGKTCETCHNTQNWKRVSSAMGSKLQSKNLPKTSAKVGGNLAKNSTTTKSNAVFDHNQTAFPLVGKHKSVACKTCHGPVIGKMKNFQDCSGCHADPHKGAFAPKACSSCHTPEGFKTVTNTPSASTQKENLSSKKQAPSQSMSGFDHATTGFPLAGRHQAVTCENCHVGGKFKGIGRSCNSCHNDFHKGELGMECERCHSPMIGFNDIEFNHNRQARFRIDGAHTKNACNQCHWNNKYKFGDFSCSTCHRDVHKGSFGPNCDKCHTTSGFVMSEGFHEFGSFRITGVHDKIDCVTCHNPKKPARARPMECASCHKDPHMGSLSQECSSCHGQIAWMPTTFRHNQTGFELSGAHRFLSCDRCHANRIFGGLSSECIFCHSKDFNASLPQHVGATTTCNTCHFTFGFRPAKK